MERLFKHNRIKTRVLSVVAIGTFLMCLFSILLVYTSANREFDELYSQALLQNLETFGDILQLKLNPIVQSTRSTVYSKKMIEDLYSLNVKQTKSGKLDDKTSINIRRELTNLTFQEPDISTILLYDEKGAFSLATNNNNENLFEYERLNNSINIENEGWYKAVRAANGKEVFFSSNVISGNSGQFSFAKAIRDPDNLINNLGIIVIIIDKSVLTDVFSGLEDSQDRSTTIILADEDKRNNQYAFIYSTNTDITIQEEYLRKERAGYLHDNPYLVISYQHELTGWTLIGAVNKRMLSSASLTFLKDIAFAIAGVLILTIILSFVLSNVITKPLIKLKSVLNHFSDTGEPITEEFDENELGDMSTYIKEIVNNYISLSEKMAQLHSDMEEANFKALQAQINPHFLYNALNLIYTMALIRGADDIAEITNALSDIFKISLSKGESIIPLSKELEYIRKYVLIQQYRFSKEKIQLNIECGEDLLDYPLPKFLIQPLVENSVLHGIEPTSRYCHLNILCHTEDQYLFISVEDDGIGTDEEDIFYHGYALNNIKERIHLLYGNSFGIKINSSYEKGTRIVLQLPKSADIIMTKSEKA